MKLQLRVLQGTLKTHDGAALGADIAVHGKRFVIGSGADCHMRCPSSAISEYHCELVAEDQGIFVRDLQSESGTYVNGKRITTKSPVAHGDHLRVGKLEFEVILTTPQSVPAAAKRSVDPVGDNISEMLAAADAEERSQQKHDPTARLFKPPAAVKPVESTDEPTGGKRKLVRPPAKPPVKLPPPPKIVADNTVNAAEQVLKKFFEKPKK